MKIAIMFASVEGHTRKIAETVAAQLEELKASADLIDLTQPGLPAFQTYDAIILAAPIHIGKYPPAFERFVMDWKSELVNLPTAMVSVSLSYASPLEGEREDAIRYPDELKERTGWKADRVHHAAGALKYVEYDFFRRFMMRRIAQMEGGPTDTSKDHELTDWDALKEFIAGFVLETDMVT